MFCSQLCHVFGLGDAELVHQRARSADVNFDRASDEYTAEGEQGTDGQINDRLAFNRAVTTEMRPQQIGRNWVTPLW